MKKISVIVPVYNGEKWLRMCLDSIQNSTYKNLEILLIDDGSTDSSPSICNEYCEADTRFIYFRKENGGQPDARNFGINKATGDFLSFVDQDDLVHPKMYEILIENAVKTDSLVSCCSYSKDYEDYQTIIDDINSNVDKISNETTILENPILNVTCLIDPHIEGMIWNKIYHKSFFKNHNFDESIPLVDDADFSVRLFLDLKPKTVYTDVVFYHWMQHADNQSYSSSYTKYYKAAMGLKKLADYCKLSGGGINFAWH